MWNFIFKRKSQEADPFDKVNLDDIYIIAMHNGSTYEVPFAWININEDFVLHKGRYYYINMQKVDAIYPKPQ